MKSKLGKAVLAGLLIGVMVVGVGTGANGATLIWRGGWIELGGEPIKHGDGASWSDANNWELDGQMGVRAPQNGDELVFPILDAAVSTNYTLYNDLENLAPARLTFRGSGYNLQGNTLRLGGEAFRTITIDLLPGRWQLVTITLGVELTSDLTVWTDSTRSNGRVQWDGPISGPYGIIKTGPTEWDSEIPSSPVLGGRLRMGGVNNKTYTGNSVCLMGRLEATAENSMPYGPGRGNVVIGAGADTVFGFNPPTGVNVNINGLAGGGMLDKFASGTKSLILGNGDANAEFSGVFQETQATGAGGSGGGRLQLTKVGNGTQIFSGSGTLSHQVNVNAGTLVINGTFTHLDFTLPAGTTGWTEAQRLENDWTVAAGATLRGNGSVTLYDMMAVSGTLAPGHATGTLDVTAGRFRLMSGSTLAIELGGTLPGDGAGFYDQLNLLRTDPVEADYLQEGVTLAVSLVGGFVPQAGDVFYIMTRADANAFAIPFAGLAEGAKLTVGGVELTITYQADWRGSQAASAPTGGNDVALYVAMRELLGDTNKDGVVDLADYNNVVNNLGATGLGVLGDTNKDGVVDLADYNNVVNNLGATLGSSLAVPEPAALGLWSMLGLLALGRRRAA